MQRQDHIQGLRAVAVLHVLIFHAFPQALPGGFIGVDLFFVISGFLISRNSLAHIQSGEFSALSFLRRRLLRLVPALLPVLWFLLILGWFFALPSEYASLAQYVRSGAVFSSNWLSYSEAGYFDVEATTKPLLHLWSLGVEMSFYVGIAVIFGVFTRINTASTTKTLVWVTVVCFVLSFLLSVWFAAHDFKAAYFSPLPRAWEFLAGVLLAILTRKSSEDGLSKQSAPLTLFVFVLLIFLSLVLATRKEWGFPGWVALFPALAGVLALAQSPNSLLAKVLSRRALVWFGNISYPLYLWHWPLITLGWIYLSTEPPFWFRGAAVVASIVLAWLTFRFVEKPFSKVLSRPRWAALLLISLTLVTAAVGQNIYSRQGLEFRDTPALQTEVVGELDAPAYFDYLKQNFVICENPALLVAADVYEGRSRCYQSRPGSVSVLLLGDSHAEHLLPGVARRMPDEVVGLALGSGAPIYQNDRFTAYFEFATQSTSIHTVIVSALWLDRMKQMPNPSMDFKQAFQESIERLTVAGKRVFLLGDVPAFDFHPKRCKYARPGQIGQCSENLSARLEQILVSEKPLRDMASLNSRVDYWSPIGCFCQDGVCRMTAGNNLLFRDKNHLTVQGSEYLAECFAKSDMRARGLTTQ